jgi:hypothetical protein
MNEQEAENFIKVWDAKPNTINTLSGEYMIGMAEGYLEAIDKAEVLAECIDGLICGTCDGETAEEVLRKWEREK